MCMWFGRPEVVQVRLEIYKAQVHRGICVLANADRLFQDLRTSGRAGAPCV